MTLTGPLLILAHLRDILLPLALLAIAAGLGQTILRAVGLRPDRPIDAITFGTAIGLGIVATAVLALGLLGVLYPTILGCLFVLLVVWARADLLKLPRLVRRAWTEIGGGDATRGLLWIAVTVTATVAAFGVLMALAPPTDWDSLMYHLQVPNQFLEAHRVHLPEDNLHVAFIGFVHLLYAPLLAAGSTAGAAVLSWLLAVLLGLAVYSVGSRWHSHATASLALTLLWGTTMLVLVAVTPRVDVTLALYTLLAHQALLIALADDDRRGRAWFYLAAAVLGMAVGIKYHALAYGLALSPLVLWIAARSRDPKAASRRLLLFGLLALAAASPWLFKNWLLLGAPLHPLFADPTLEPWLASLYGGVAVPPSVDPVALEALRHVRVPFNVLDAFFRPSRLTVEPEGIFYGLSFVLLALPLWIVFRRNRAVNWLIAPAIIYAVAVLSVSDTTNLRYLIPAVAPLTIAAVWLIVEASTRLMPTRALRLGVIGLIVVVTLSSTARMMARRLTRTRAVSHLVGHTSAREYLATHYDASIQRLVPLMRHANAELPDSARVLMLFDARGLYFRPATLQDNRLTNWPLLAPLPTVDECLRGTGITHVLLSAGVLNYYVLRGLDPETVRWSEFGALADRCLVPVLDSRGIILFEVKGPEAVSGPTP